MPITINGTGTITGISAGGLPDDSIIAADIAAGAVTPAKLSTGAPSWTSGGDITISSLYGTNMIKTGTGDNATRSTYNIAIKGWWGIAFQDYSDTVNRVLDCRDGTFQSLVPSTSSFMREYTCRAWVNFDGTTASPSTRRGSGNVSSVTKNGTGDYTVNFTTAMPDANYSPVIQFYFDGASVFHPPIGTLSTSSLGVRGYKSGTGNFDVNGICVAIFR